MPGSVVSPQCNIEWAVIFHQVKMDQMDKVLNRIPMKWSRAGVWRKKEEGRERLGRRQQAAMIEGKKVQTFASVCLAPVYGLNNSIVARGKWHMGALKCFDIFCSNRFFYGQGKRPSGVQPVQICLCFIKGSNFLFISGPHPPTKSSCLIIPPLQTAPSPMSSLQSPPRAPLLVSCLPVL